MSRTYKDPHLQRAYDGYVEAYRSGNRGWVSPGVHGLWRKNGTRFRGASGHAAFWNGFDGLTLRRGRLMYVPGSIARVAYMAGRDARRAEEKRR